MSSTADFRRFLRRPLSLREYAVIERMERQRRQTRRVRAYICDPDGQLTPLLLSYIHWHQQRLDFRNAIVVSHRRLPRQRHLRLRTFTARTINSSRGHTSPVGQVLITGADRYRLDVALAAVVPCLSGPGTILIVTGNPERKSVFSRLYLQYQAQAPYFQTIDPMQPLRLPVIRPKPRLIFAFSSPSPPSVSPPIPASPIINIEEATSKAFLTHAEAVPRVNSRRSGRVGVSPQSDTTTHLDILSIPVSHAA